MLLPSCDRRCCFPDVLQVQVCKIMPIRPPLGPTKNGLQNECVKIAPSNAMNRDVWFGK